jgi:hypothetical protein
LGYDILLYKLVYIQNKNRHSDRERRSLVNFLSK